MTDLIAYCPEIKTIKEDEYRYFRLKKSELPDLIAAALCREIKRRGDWNEFYWWSRNKYEDEDNRRGASWHSDWLTDAETFCRVAGEFAKTNSHNDSRVVV